MDGYAFKNHLPTGGRTKVLCFSLVSTSYGVAAYHLVSLSQHIIDADADVGEGREESGGELLALLVASDLLIWFVPDEVGSVDLI